MATLSTSGGLTSLPPRQDQRHLDLFVDASVGVLPFGHQLSHRCLYQQQHIPGHPLIYPLIQSSLEINSDLVDSVDRSVMKVNEVQISSPDYDNDVGVGQAEVKGEDGAETVVGSVNGQRFNFEAHGQPDANRPVGRGGNSGGGSSDGEGEGGPSVGECYKSGGGDTESTGSCCGESRGSQCVSSAGVTCEPDAEKNVMGNDLFRARTASVGDARAGCHAGENVRGTADRVKSSQGTFTEVHTEPRLTHSDCAQRHADGSPRDPSREPRAVAPTSTDTKDLETLTRVPVNTVPRDAAVVVSQPSSSRVQPWPDSGQDVNFSGVSERGSTGQATRFDLTHRHNGDSPESGQNNDASSEPEAGQKSRATPVTVDVNLPQTPDIGSREAEQYHSTTRTRTVVTSSHPVSSTHSTATAASTSYIPLLDVLPKDIPVIFVTPCTPEVKSPASTAPVSASKTPDGTITSARPPGTVNKEAKIKGNNSLKENVNPEDSQADRKKINENGKTEVIPALKHPAGGVKVLPSKFTFNFHSFRDAKKTDKHVSSDQNNPVIPSPSQEHPAGNTSAAEYAAEHSQHGSRNRTGTNVNSIKITAATTSLSQPSSPSATATSSVTGQPAASATFVKSSKSASSDVIKRSDHEILSSTNTRNSAIGAKSVEEYTWGDYAVPSDVIRSPASPGKQKVGAAVLKETSVSHYSKVDTSKAQTQESSFTESANGSHYIVISCHDEDGYRETDNVDTRNNREVTKHNVGGHLKHDIAKMGLYTEEDYAVPIPKSQRQVASLNSGKYTKVFPGQQLAAAEPPQKPAQNSQSLHSHEDVFDDVIIRNKALVSSHMKKSTTTDTLHSISFSFSDSSRHNRSYDYFSLGRRPKRPKITLSLDMLLRSRRESLLDVSSTPAAEQALSVDDILQSCKEFEENIASQRLVTSSDNIKYSPTQPLSFIEASNIHIPPPAQKGKPTRRTHSVPTKSRPILKNSQSTGPKTEITKRREYVTIVHSQDSKQSVGVQPGHTVSKMNWRFETSGLVTSQVVPMEGKQQSPPTSAASGIIGRDKELTSSENSERKQATALNSTIKTEATRKPDIIQSYRFTDTHGKAENHMTSKIPANILPVTACERSQPVSHKGEQNLGCDSPSDTPSSKVTEVRSTDTAEVRSHVSSKGKEMSNILTSDNVSTVVTKPLGNLTTEVKTATRSTRSHIDKKKKKTEISQSKPQPTSTVSQTHVHVAGTATTDTRVSASDHVLSSPLESTTSGSRLGSNISSSSYLAGPPLSVTLPSESSSVSHPGAMASLTVDVSCPGLADSSSPKHKSPSFYAKLEAVEALKWLRAAGFPQYAQMFEDGQFPVDMCVVERDHDFLDKDSLKSLFRRLETLNKYAGIKFDAHPCKKATSEEEDDDDLCALSERWEYQKSVRRWSRKDLSTSPQKTVATETDRAQLAAHSGSHDSLLADQDSGSQTGDSPLLESKMPHQTDSKGDAETALASCGGTAVAENASESQGQPQSPVSPGLKRTASERIKTAKNLFKKMEGLKSKKSRRQPAYQNVVEISGPVVADRENMQAKLERLNCVDISSTSKALSSPPATRTKASDNVDSGLRSGRDGHRTSCDASVSSTSPSSPSSASSPRPHSDFVSRPKDIGGPLSPRLASANQTQAGHTSPGPSSPLTHSSSFDEYHAQAALFQNLQSGVTKKNTNDTSLMEIFLVPQDHQPGRFPRMLQNGYIETEACGTAVNARTGSVRLGRGTGVTSDHSQGSSDVVQTSRTTGVGYRVSVYDNFLLPDAKKGDASGTQSTIPRVTDSASASSDSAAGENAEISKRGLVLGTNSDCVQRDTSSVDSSLARTSDVSDQEQKDSVHERSPSFESSSSSQTPRESTPASDAGLASNDSRSSRKSSPESLSSKSKGVPHSSSVDSYFRGSSSQSEVSGSDNSETTSTSTLQPDYDEFDRILQQLYQNIDDLTSYMGKERPEKTPKLVRAATSPLPSGSKSPHSHMHVASSSARTELKAFDPRSPPSSLPGHLPSPELPRSQNETSESMDFYRGLDLDNENSSSGGEGSNTAESGSEDQEVALTDLSHDDSLDPLDQIPEVSRERRDSGVGHSLTRATSDRRRKKIRWHSFQKCHRPDISSRAMQVNSLTVGQLVRLQKLSLLRLTGIMEKCLPVNKSGWNWMMPRFMKRNKVPDFSDKNVFGVPLGVMAQRTGQPLPQCVLYAMRYLRRTCNSAVGIFRKSGVKSKIQQLRDHLEAHPDTTDFEGVNAYNVADMLKTYFRDLPECLLTNKMSETFRSIYTHVPPPQRLEAIQAAILLLPDENREVLQSILLFLSDISSHEADHQMNASNLAVCFTPTVFQLGPRQVMPYSPKRNRKNLTGIPDPRELMEQKAAHECLLMMITECKKLFTVPPNLFRQLQVQSLAHVEPTLLQDISSSPADVRAFGQERIQLVLKESHDKNRGWIPTMTAGDVEVFHRKPMDDCPLKEWKLVVDIEAPPVEVLRRIMHERHTWDEDLLSWSVLERLDPYSDIFLYVLNSMAPHPSRNFCVLRYWRSDLNKGACALITMSVEHSENMEVQGVWAVDLGSYFLMEPCGSGRTRLTYITRVDTKGRMPEWYTKIFGHICANFLERLRDSFKQETSGPETKV